MATDNPLITIASFDNYIEAEIFRSRLESFNIKTYIADDNITTMNPLYSFAVGGVKVQVHRSDAERAYEVFRSIESGDYIIEEE